MVVADVRRLGSGAADAAPRRLGACDDDINQVAVSASGEHVATADDSGAVTVFNSSEGGRVRHIAQAHANICTCVAFRPRRPWEILSGGLDCHIALWDFSNGRPRTRIAAEAEDAGSGEGGTGRMCNPPMVHALAVPSHRDWAHWAAAARGDGCVAVYDMNAAADTKRSKARKGQPPPAACVIRGHASGVGHVAFADGLAGAGGGAACPLLSAGNDRRLALWDWYRVATSKGAPGGEGEGEEKAEIDDRALWSQIHGHKINWTAARRAGSENVVIADTSDAISLYSIPLH